MRNIIPILVCFFVLNSCENSNPAFRFSNFKGTEAETISKAIEDEDIETIRNEIKQKKVSVNFEDKKYEVSLLELAVVNYKKEAFEELLKLGADPNIENSSCESILISAIRYNENCDLYFVEKLLENGANLKPKFFEKCNYFSNEPICETIFWYNDNNIECGFKILKLLTSKLNDPKVLYINNNEKDYQQNIIYNCLSTGQNIRALKYLIVDLKYEAPKEIYIDGTIIYGYEGTGYKNLVDILNSQVYVFDVLEREKAKNEILSYLENNK